jgi:hypothetical protein
MSTDDEKEKQKAAENKPAAETSQGDAPLPLADELGVDDLNEILFAEHGRVFSAAGRESPIAELRASGVMLYPPNLPFSDAAPAEVIVFKGDKRGILLNELGEPRRIVGAKFKGRELFTLLETKPDTVKHYAGWFDDKDQPHKLYVQGQALTSDMVFRIRNRTPDGEISMFPEITSD